jgi:mannose-6-phosphate isomerase-like protein (cupin superfamily)
MAASKYGKYFVTQPKADEKLAPWRQNYSYAKDNRLRTKIALVDSEVIEGAFHTSAVWLWPREGTETDSPEPHTHPFSEVLAFLGTNPDDVSDLGGEIEVWLEDEKFTMTKSFIVFIPAGMKHCPIYLRRIDRPILHYIATNSGVYA